uniref:Terpenoid synthase n=1 Tax=Candidatus Kentrum sp. DK TaxID=2126562 RepID=A0A450SFA8_9GAMM|nr:MAG: hypothetical protein BECKDK2373C_GA0170839_10329 [Candidatus Kentron sp. DK]
MTKRPELVRLPVSADEITLGKSVLASFDVMDATETVAAIERKEIGPALAPFINRYEQVGERDAFLWKFAWESIDLFTLPCIDPNWREYLLITKMLGAILLVVFDDVADQDRNGEILESLISAVQQREPESKNGAGSQKLAFVGELWLAIRERRSHMPRHGEFGTLLDFDYTQLFNSFRYALLVNIAPSLSNRTEHNLYHPHSMHIMVSATLDLMCSPDFASEEHGILREAVWNAQMMGRLSNCVTTWHREIKERDYSGNVFSLALERGIIHSDELRGSNTMALERKLRASEIEYLLLATWARHREKIIELSTLVHSVDLIALVRGLEKLLGLHISCRGYI